MLQQTALCLGHVANRKTSAALITPSRILNGYTWVGAATLLLPLSRPSALVNCKHLPRYRIAIQPPALTFNLPDPAFTSSRTASNPLARLLHCPPLHLPHVVLRPSHFNTGHVLPDPAVSQDLPIPAVSVYMSPKPRLHFVPGRYLPASVAAVVHPPAAGPAASPTRILIVPGLPPRHLPQGATSLRRLQLSYSRAGGSVEGAVALASTVPELQVGVAFGILCYSAGCVATRSFLVPTTPVRKVWACQAGGYLARQDG